MSNTQVQEVAFKRLEEHLAQKGDLFAAQHAEEIKQYAPQLVQEFITATIAIPRVTIQPGKDGYLNFKPFELDTTNITYQPASEEIFLKSLTDGGYSFLQGQVSGDITQESPENILLGALFDVPEISYDDYADLLHPLAQAVIAQLRTYLDDKAVKNVVITYRHQLADFIFAHMKQHSEYVPADLTSSKVRPFEKIYPHNYEKISSDKIYNYRETIEPRSAIPSKVFTGFQKACHNLYKFDSKAEKDFAQVLEQSDEVQKWLRPHIKQFNIYWNNGQRPYEPDFVVETADKIFLVEIKSARDIDSKEVEEKVKASLFWIKRVNEYAKEQGEKTWEYLLIPHTEVDLNNDFSYFKQFKK